jgi:hypothetical protein
LGGEMTQTMYAQVNKWIKKKKFNSSLYIQLQQYTLDSVIRKSKGCKTTLSELDL